MKEQDGSHGVDGEVRFEIRGFDSGDGTVLADYAAVCYHYINSIDVVLGLKGLSDADWRVCGGSVVFLDDQVRTFRLREGRKAERGLMLGISHERDGCRLWPAQEFGNETFADATVAAGDEICFRHGLCKTGCCGWSQ